MRERNAQQCARGDPLEGFLETDEGEGAPALGVRIAVADALPSVSMVSGWSGIQNKVLLVGMPECLEIWSAPVGELRKRPS